MFGLSLGSNGPRSTWSNEVIGEIQILISLIFFGASFIGQRYSMLHGIGPISYNACRYIFSTLFLCIAKYGIGLKSSYEKEDEKNRNNEAPSQLSNLWFYGICLGICNFAGSILQQIGLVTVTAGKTGFITGMYVVIVPIAEYLVPGFDSNLNLMSWLAAGLSFVGLFLLSGCAGHEQCFGGAIKMGEVIVFISMFCWVVSIMLSDVGSKKVEVVTLTLIDFFITTIITIGFALYFEPEAWVYPYTSIRSNWISIVVVGFSEAVAFTLSTLGQMYTPPSRAAVLYSLEAVVCAVLSYFCLNEHLRFIEIIGGG
jgi:drug/metabolite transporter (DMT)-like permease